MADGGIEIRSARVDEADAVLACYEWLFAPPGSRPQRWNPAWARVALVDAIDSDSATVLVAAARRWAADRGASHLELDSAQGRVEAHRFYEREGARNPSLSFGWYGIDEGREQ